MQCSGVDSRKAGIPELHGRKSILAKNYDSPAKPHNILRCGAKSTQGPVKVQFIAESK